jgi:hypothetical protein
MADKQTKNKQPYDRSKMQHKDNILRFQWGDYKAIGIKHFEERRDERTKRNGTDIFDKINLTDEQVLLECFKILHRDKYDYILTTIEKNKPKHTEWVVGFETDELADRGDDYKFVFLVFSISVKETAMNGIEKGETFLSCITVVKDTYKNVRKLPDTTVEETLCYYRPDGGDHEWKNQIPRQRPTGR